MVNGVKSKELYNWPIITKFTHGDGRDLPCKVLNVWAIWGSASCPEDTFNMWTGGANKRLSLPPLPKPKLCNSVSHQQVGEQTQRLLGGLCHFALLFNLYNLATLGVSLCSEVPWKRGRSAEHLFGETGEMQAFDTGGELVKLPVTKGDQDKRDDGGE